MKGLAITAIILLGIGLAAAVVWGVLVNQQKNALSVEAAYAESSLAAAQAELETTADALLAREAELDDAQSSLATTQSELDATQRTLSATSAELTVTKQSLANTQADLAVANQSLASVAQTSAGLEDDLAAAQQQLDTALETLDGLGITLSASRDCYDVTLVDNPEATNPTFDELTAFLARDRTEQHTYILDVYDCSQFSRDVHNNAEAAGIRTAEVQIFFRGEWTGHALNAFITTDYGLVYVDCTEPPDTIARVKVGKEYRSVEVYRVAPANIRNDVWWDGLSDYYYFTSPTGGHCVTDGIEIFW